MPDLDELPGSVNMTFVDPLERDRFDPTLSHVLLSYVQPVESVPSQSILSCFRDQIQLIGLFGDCWARSVSTYAHIPPRRV